MNIGQFSLDYLGHEAINLEYLGYSYPGQARIAFRNPRFASPTGP
jgi:hypothetical protein